MTSLANRVEIIKLAEALGVEKTELDALAAVPSDDIRTLREALGEAIFTQHEARFRRIAKLAGAVPAAVSARIAQMALTPLLGARVAAVMEPGLAVKLAGSLDTDYLASLSALLDPARAEAIVTRMPSKTITQVGRAMVADKSYVALGRFVSVIDPDIALDVVHAATGRDLLQVALFAEDPDALDELVQRIDDERLVEAIRAAHADGLYDDAVTLVASVAPATRRRLVPLIAALEPDGIDAFAQSLHRFDAWAAILPALAVLDDSVLAPIANCRATLEPGLLTRMIEVAESLDLQDVVERLPRILDASHKKVADKALTSS